MNSEDLATAARVQRDYRLRHIALAGYTASSAFPLMLGIYLVFHMKKELYDHALNFSDVFSIFRNATHPSGINLAVVLVAAIAVVLSFLVAAFSGFLALVHCRQCKERKLLIALLLCSRARASSHCPSHASVAMAADDSK